MGMDPIESTSKEINKDDILSRDDLYIQILLEKEEQIFQLKDEVSDLKTLVRVLESENDRLKGFKQ